MAGIPAGFHTVTPMLAVKSAEDAIAWYKKVFDATEIMRLTEPGGKIAHAELAIGDSRIMLAEDHPDYNKSPATLHGTSVIIHLYVDDVDDIIVRAVKEGAQLIFPVKDQFYGDRSGRFQDPFGHMWIVATVLRQVPHEEMQRLFDEMMQNNSM